MNDEKLFDELLEKRQKKREESTKSVTPRKDQGDSSPESVEMESRNPTKRGNDLVLEAEKTRAKMLIPQVIPARDDLWLVGTTFAGTANAQLLQIRADMLRDNNEEFYFTRAFATYPFINASGSTAVKNFAKIVNEIRRGLSHNGKLPKLVLIIPDGDLLSDLTSDPNAPGASVILKRVITWMIDEIIMAFETRKQVLPIRAIDRKNSLNIPTVVFVKATVHRNLPNNGLRHLYNKILESSLSGFQFYKSINGDKVIPFTTSPENPPNFNPDGTVTQNGFKHLWTWIDKKIEVWDKTQSFADSPQPAGQQGNPRSTGNSIFN